MHSFLELREKQQQSGGAAAKGGMAERDIFHLFIRSQFATTTRSGLGGSQDSGTQPVHSSSQFIWLVICDVHRSVSEYLSGSREVGPKMALRMWDTHLVRGA